MISEQSFNISKIPLKDIRKYGISTYTCKDTHRNSIYLTMVENIVGPFNITTG